MKEKAHVCPKCQRVVPFSNPNFCCFCGHKLTKKNFKELPVCPPSISEGHCDECRKKKAKTCDDCGNANEVEYRPEYNNKCLCYACRMGYATFASLSRSY